MGNIEILRGIEDLIIEISGKKVLLDRDVATLYGVETKRINEAVKNNPDRFSKGYIIEIDNDTKKELVENFDRFKTLKHSSVKPKAFTEKGLYMLATILTSKEAIKVSITIIETFTKLRELSNTIKKLPSVTDKKEEKSLMQKSGEILA